MILIASQDNESLNPGVHIELTKGYRIIRPSRLNRIHFPFFSEPDVFSKYTPPRQDEWSEGELDSKKPVDRYSFYNGWIRTSRHPNPFLEHLMEKSGIPREDSPVDQHNSSAVEPTQRKDSIASTDVIDTPSDDWVKVPSKSELEADARDIQRKSPPSPTLNSPGEAKEVGRVIELVESEDGKRDRREGRRRQSTDKKKRSETFPVPQRRSLRPPKRNSKYVRSSSESDEFDLDAPIVVRLSQQPSSPKRVRKRPEKKARRDKEILEDKNTEHGEKRIQLQQTRSLVVDNFRADLQAFARYLGEGERNQNQMFLEWLKKVKDAVESGSLSKECVLKDGQRELIRQILLDLKKDEGELTLAFLGAFSKLMHS